MQKELIKILENNDKRNMTETIIPSIHSRAGSDTGWEIVLGTVVAVSSPAEAMVQMNRTAPAETIKARTVVALDEKQIGQLAVVAYEGGDLTKPIILGLVQSAENVAKKVSLAADGERFVVTAEREIELRCGEASITLTRAGKVLIKGEYVLCRSKGVNRIKGAAVSIN